MSKHRTAFCGRTNRRQHLVDLGMGFGGLALGSLLNQSGWANALQESGDGAVHSTVSNARAKAKNVIWIFLSGGVSHLETFDPKPLLNQFAGKTFEETGLPNPQKLPIYRERSRSVVGMDREVVSTIMPLQVDFKQYGENGIWVSDWLPNLAQVVDDLCIVRSMYTTDNDHNAEFQFQNGRHSLDEQQPCIGSWISYGLGSLNENLPQFVFLGKYSDNRVKRNFDANYLGPQHAGVELSLDPANPLPFGRRASDMLAAEQQAQFELIHRWNQLSALEHPDDAQLQARIRAYELAYRMQMSAPEVLGLTDETPETLALYGMDDPVTELYGRRLLTARRLAERGVRYTLVYLSDYGEWDSHSNIKDLHAKCCGRVDKPLAGLLRDLKQRGMLDETLVVCATEFGRTPALEKTTLNQAGTGRDHHPHGFTIWLAGGGVKPGYVHGATDELGFHAIENPHYVTDIHATTLHLLGQDPTQLNIPGRKRLEIDYGHVIHDIIA